MIKGVNITKTYRYKGFKKIVLDSVDIEIKEKTITLITGKYGRGEDYFT